VNGPLLERWFLKTLIYLSVSGDWAIGLGSHKKGTPSQQLVRIAFGHEAFEPYEGLYIAGYPGENIHSMDRVSFAPMTEGDNLVVGRFNFRGYRFYLSLVPEKVENFEGSPLLYRNSKSSVYGAGSAVAHCSIEMVVFCITDHVKWHFRCQFWCQMVWNLALFRAVPCLPQSLKPA